MNKIKILGLFMIFVVVLLLISASRTYAQPPPAPVPVAIIVCDRNLEVRQAYISDPFNACDHRVGVAKALCKPTTQALPQPCADCLAACLAEGYTEDFIVSGGTTTPTYTLTSPPPP